MTLPRPAAVAVHDDRHVPRELRGIQLSRKRHVGAVRRQPLEQSLKVLGHGGQGQQSIVIATESRRQRFRKLAWGLGLGAWGCVLGSSFLVLRSSVLHVPQREPLRWRRSARLPAIARREDGLDISGRPSSKSDLRQRPNDVSHHVAKKACAGDLVAKKSIAARGRAQGGDVDPTHGRRQNSANGGFYVAPRCLKGREIALADKRRSSRVHGGHIERLWDVPHVSTKHW